MKENRRKNVKSLAFILCFLLTLCVIGAAMADVGGYAQTGVDRFNHSFDSKLTGDPAYDIVTIALAQVEKTGNELGFFYGNWCAAFVVDCAKYAGASNAIPFISGRTHGVGGAGGYAYLYEIMLQRGASVVSLSSAKRGDIVFFGGSEGDNYSHVGIMVDNVNTVEGNLNGNGNYRNAKVLTSTRTRYSRVQILRPNYPNPKATIDLNGYLDNVNNGALGSYGTVDVYINGSLASDDTWDYCTAHPIGTRYEIMDIKAKPGYEYLGVRNGSLSGTIGSSGTIDIRLSFATQGNLHIAGSLDGVPDDSLADYGTFDVYINGEIIAANVASYNRQWPNGTSYIIKNCQPINDKLYDGIECYEGVIRSNTESKVMLPFTSPGIATPEWHTGKSVPGNLDREQLDIEYKYIYSRQARTSPGTEWILVQEGNVQYENDGAPYYDDNDALATSASLERIGYYYFHWCNNTTWANYYQKSEYPVKHLISMEDAAANFRVEEKGTDGDGSGRKYYYLTHLNGPYAGGIAKCGSNGTQVYYRGGVYQKKKAYQINTYQSETDWTSTFDSSATSISVRWRLKEGVDTEYKGLRLNFVVDGESVSSLDGVAGLDIFINGEQKTSNATTYRAYFPGDFAYQIQLNYVADDKLYKQIEGGELHGTVEEPLKTLTLYFETGVEPTENWKNITENLLPYLDENAEIEYRHTYAQNARTSPGEDWTMVKEGAVQYENNGAPYYDDNDALATSATLARVGYYYFHWCNNGTWANYYQKSEYPVKHTITMEDASANFSVQEKGTDGDGSGRKYYYLTHLNGPYAGGIAKCGTNGTQVYYRGGVYQKKTAYRINTYQKVGEWTTELDTTATSIEYRIRLKQYVITFDANGGTFDMDELLKYSGKDLVLPIETPNLDLNSFVCWNTEYDGTGTAYKPGDVYDLNQDIVLHAIWKEISSITLPANLLVVEEEALAGIDAMIIRVPNGCTEIQSRAFLNCPNLRRIYIPASASAVALDAFDGCVNLTICAPAGSTAIKVAKYNDIPYEEVEY